MRFPALLAALALIGACAAPPEPDNRPAIEAVQPGHFASQQLFELKQVKPGSSYLKRLLEDVPLDQLRDISVESESWKAHGQPKRSDVFLTAPDPETLEAFVRSDVRLDVPLRQQIATATLSRDDHGKVKGELVFMHAGRAQVHDLTARAVGEKVALLVVIDMPRAEITFGGT